MVFSRRLISIVAVLVSCALVTSGCAAGFNAPTNQQKATGNGRMATVGNIDVRAATIVIDPTKPGKAALVGTIINTAEKTDTFTELQVGAPIGTTIPTNLELAPQQPAQIGYNSELSVIIPTNELIKAGDFLTVRFIFANNDVIPLSLIVNNNDGVYSDVVVP